jgi:hypothetical protein
MISYNTKLLGDTQALIDLLEVERSLFNDCSVEQFPESKRSIVVLHKKCYYKMKERYPQAPSQVIIRAEGEVLSAYKSIKSNKHKITEPAVKKRLSMRLDKRLYRVIKDGSISITTLVGRKTFKLHIYPKLQSLLEAHAFRDPLIFVRNGEVYISLTFDIAPEPAPSGSRPRSAKTPFPNGGRQP